MHAVPKDLDLDYAFCEEKQIAPSVIHEDYVNKMREHTVSLVKWMTSNELTKLIIKQTISVELMEVLPDKKNNRELTAKEFYKSIDLYFKRNSLLEACSPHIMIGKLILVSILETWLEWLMS